MKIALAQLNYLIGDFEGTAAKMESAISDAINAGADLIVFSELSVCGYPPRDFLEFEDFIEQSQAIVDRIRYKTDEIAIVLGAPTVNPQPEGKDLFNSAYFLHEKKVIHIAHKTLLPTYDIFDEYRYFEPNTEFGVVEFMGERIALTICEDIWNVGNENPLYTISPMDELIKHAPTLMINISASPFNFEHASERIRILKANTEKYNVPIFYCNHVGAQTEIIFDGGSLIMAPDGTVVEEMAYFEEEIGYFDLDEVRSASIGTGPNVKESIDLIHRGLVLGLRDYFTKLGFQKALIGLSGGIDSAVTLAIAAEALGKENVTGVMMPSKFSSDHSVDDAKSIIHNIGCKGELIPIEKPYDVMLEILEPHFQGRPFDITEENLQARIRAVYLMALSNKLGGIVLNTSNKSESAVGYGTLYGDMVGGLSVLGDVYKTQVFDLARHINRDKEIIPWNSINKPPSAELRPNQLDSDSLPEYEILDKVLFQYIEERKSPADIIEMGFDRSVVDHALSLVNRNEYKRYQTSPMLRVSRKAFGMGRRMPIVGKYLS